MINPGPLFALLSHSEKAHEVHTETVFANIATLLLRKLVQSQKAVWQEFKASCAAQRIFFFPSQNI